MTQAKKIDYAKLQDELAIILADLQREDHDIDSAIKQYGRGLEIVKMLEEYLQTAENTVRQLQVSFDEQAE